MRYIAATIFLLLIAGQSWSQSNQAIGSWRSYLPYRFGFSVTQSDDAIYYGTRWALLKINKEDFSLEYFSKMEGGLNDIGIRSVDFVNELNLLIVVYTNSNIDLVFEDETVNLNQILNNTQIVGDRTIYDVFVDDAFAYLACGFGLVQLNLIDREFGFTAFTNSAVKGVARDDIYLLASTESGLFRVEDSPSNNLADFESWEFMGTSYGLPTTYTGTAITLDGSNVFVGLNSDLYKKTDNGSFELIHREPGYEYAFLARGAEGLLTGWSCQNGCNGKKILIEENGGKKTINNCSTRPLDAIVDEENRVWYADEGRDYKYTLGITGECLRIIPDRPPTHNASQIATHNGNLYVATGGVTVNYGYLFRSEGFYTNEGNTWTSYNKSNVDILREKDMRDFLSIKSAADGTIYIGTFWDGLIQYRDGEITVFDRDNSSLQNSVINPDRNRVTDMDFDQEGNLWILNHDAPEPVSVYSKDGEWLSFPLPAPGAVEHIAVDGEGYKWIAVGRVGLVVFDTGPDLFSTSDDRYQLINATNSELTVNAINDIAVEKDGNVWVGTTEGPVQFRCGTAVFDGDCIGNRQIVDQNGVPGVLLGGENIKAIAIDGANQKWFGTSSGVFVQSADGDVQIHHFNIRNSPLFDNSIIDIEIDPTEGIVFFATNKGVQSYRAEATSATPVHKSNITTFPNPVRPGYEGPIAIRGLGEDAQVKITDAQGILVHQTTAKGGQAIWDGNDLNGRRASSGVYLVFSATTPLFHKSDAAVAKIMLIN